MRSIPGFALVLAVAATGCATTGPYAEVTGEREVRGDLSEEPVIVLGVDGVYDVKGSTSVTVEPGLRMVVLATSRQDRRGLSRSSVVPLNAKPCLRYFFVAKHESMTLVEPWQLVLKDVQPIPECVAKYPEAAPKPKSGT